MGGKKIDEKPRTSNPKPPFTTSTLQQEVCQKTTFSAKNTMRVAQQLYENGFITYMRTDSTHLSDEAVKGSRHIVSDLFGDDFLPKVQIIMRRMLKTLRKPMKQFVQPIKYLRVLILYLKT